MLHMGFLASAHYSDMQTGLRFKRFTRFSHVQAMYDIFDLYVVDCRNCISAAAGAEV
jgi:hypothetical protein